MKRWSSWLLFLAAAVVVACVALMAERQSRQTPAERLAWVEQRLKAGRIDRDQALTHLDLALTEASQRKDPVLVARIRLARGRLLLGISAWDRARADVTAALEQAGLSAAERSAVEGLLVDIDTRSGEIDRALARAETVVERDPGDARALTRAGALHKKKAELLIDEARTVIESLLVPEKAARACDHLQRAAALEPSDPARVAAGREIRVLFGFGDEAKAEEVLRKAELAGTQRAQARTRLSSGLSFAYDGDALADLLDLLVLAGHAEEASQLAVCALRESQARRAVPALAASIRAFDALGRGELAADVAQDLVTRKGALHPDLLVDLAGVFYRAQRWTQLCSVCEGLLRVGSTSQRDIGNYYYGTAFVEMGNAKFGRTLLQNYLIGSTPEPFPNARALGFRRMAQASQALGQTQDEREALEGFVRENPAGAGDSWLRLAALQYAAANGGYRRPEERFARGMNQLPARTAELLPLWQKVGDQELLTSGVDLADVRANLLARRAWTPPADASPYFLYRLAQAYLEAGDAARASIFAGRLLEDLPDFLPGIDIALDAAVAGKRERETIDLVVRRMQLVGAEDRTRQILRTIQPAKLRGKDRLALMRADPEAFGRSEIARWLVERGRPEEALALLDPQGDGSVGDTDGAEGTRVLAARAQLTLLHPDKALALLAPLGRRVFASDATLDLYVDAALAAHDRAGLEQTMIQMVRSLEPARTRWHALAIRMTRAGAPAAARPLLARLDADKDGRGGMLLASLSAAALARGDRPSLAESLERAAAFETGGQAELLALFAAADARAFDSLGTAVAAVRHSGRKPTARQDACLALLENRAVAARAAVEGALASDPENADWTLIDATRHVLADETFELPARFGADAPRETQLFLRGEHADQDPRFALCVMLASDTALGAGWALREVEIQPAADSSAAKSSADAAATAGTSSPRPSGVLWPAWIEASLARTRNDLASERAALERLVAAVPGFAPAWDRLVEIAGRGRSDAGTDAQVVALRGRRLEALKAQAGTPAQRLLDRARTLLASGDVEGAAAAVGFAAEKDADPLELAQVQARVHVARGEWREAAKAFETVCLAAPPASDLPCVRGWLAASRNALAAAAQSKEPFDEKAWTATLEKVALRLPDDPRPVVALARADLLLDPQNPTLAVSRAYTRLDRFLETHRARSVEGLCAGADLEWVELYLALDPQRAASFLERERQIDPAAPAHWLLAGRVQAALGSPRNAVVELALARRLLPGPESARERARVLLGTPLGAEQIDAIAAEAREADAGAGREARLWIELAHARARYDLGPKGLSAALDTLAEIAPEPADAPEFREQHALLRALALVARGQTSDLAEAQTTLAELAPRVVDAYRRVVAEAARGLARSPAAVAQK